MSDFEKKILEFKNRLNSTQDSNEIESIRTDIFSKSGIKYFNTYDKELLIIHVIINKYTIDGKTYNFLPHNIKFKNIILELEFICLDKNLVTKIKRLFTECGININKIVSYEYAKKFLKVEKDITLCLSAKEVINGANYSEIKIQEEPDKKTSIFNKIFNVFD